MTLRARVVPSGQCCTDCTSAGRECAGWVYQNASCTLLASVSGRASCQSSRDEPCLSGARGSMPPWTGLQNLGAENGF